MASPTFRATGLVLTKTRLGEADLIVTLLGDDGSLLKGVARGARKPKNPFASRLELAAVVDLALARGRSLATITEARLVKSHGALRSSPEASFAVAPALELAARIAQPDLELPRIFDAMNAGLGAIEKVVSDPAYNSNIPDDASRACLLSLCDGMLLKNLAYAGLRPSFHACVICGEALEIFESKTYGLSEIDGGIVCDAHGFESIRRRLAGDIWLWADQLLYRPFKTIVDGHPTLPIAREILSLAQGLISAHTGYPLRSVESLFKSRLF